MKTEDLVMEKQFMEFLKTEGYSEFTPSGNKSTVYDYTMRVKRIMEYENKDWESLMDGISDIVKLYDVGGKKENIGKKSHNAYINALKAFMRFSKQ